MPLSMLEINIFYMYNVHKENTYDIRRTTKRN